MKPLKRHVSYGVKGIECLMLTLAVLAFCTSSSASTVDFEIPPPGTQYGNPAGNVPGDVVLTQDGISMALDVIHIGAWTGFIKAQIDAPPASQFPAAMNPSQSLTINNLDTVFDMAAVGFPVRSVTLDYVDLGGWENLDVNGIGLVETPLLGTVPPNKFPGFTVYVTQAPIEGGFGGVLRIVADAGSQIDTVTIGGQEFSIDRVTALPAGAPCPDLNFEDLLPGTTLPLGASTSSNGVVLTATDFYYGPGCTNPSSSGLVTVSGAGWACGSGNELEFNNRNVVFNYGKQLEELLIHYGQLGGIINLQVNGSCYVGDLASLPPVLGGVAVAASTPTGCGTLSLQGKINSFVIGGQELGIDDVLCLTDPCIDEVTPPVVAITSPPHWSKMCNDPALPIEGSAYDPDGTFDSYTLKYRHLSDLTWTTIFTGVTPVQGGLLGYWDTTGLSEGYHLLQLSAFNTCGQSASDMLVLHMCNRFDSLRIDEPEHADIVGGAVCIEGTAWDSWCFDSYSVDYRPVGGAWQAVAGSPFATTVLNDPLAVWDSTLTGDGDHIIRLTGIDTCGNTKDEYREVVVDNTPPQAEITSPLPCECVDGIVEIHGTADDANLKSWTLQYTGASSGSWTTIASGTAPVSYGILGSWDTTGLAPCPYTLRLVVYDKAIVHYACTDITSRYSQDMVSVNVETLCQ